MKLEEGTIKGNRKMVYRFKDGEVLEIDVPDGAHYTSGDKSDLYMWEKDGERISYLIQVDGLRSWEVRRDLNGEEV